MFKKAIIYIQTAFIAALGVLLWLANRKYNKFDRIQLVIREEKLKAKLLEAERLSRQKELDIINEHEEELVQIDEDYQEEIKVLEENKERDSFILTNPYDTDELKRHIKKQLDIDYVD